MKGKGCVCDLLCIKVVCLCVMEQTVDVLIASETKVCSQEPGAGLNHKTSL